MLFDHVNIAAPMAKLEEVKAFYCTMFDLSVGKRPNFSARGYWLYDNNNHNTRAILHLTEDDVTSSPSVGFLNHIAFKRSGCASFEQKLNTAGIEYQKKTVPDTRLTQLFFYDPAGVRLEILFED